MRSANIYMWLIFVMLITEELSIKSIYLISLGLALLLLLNISLSLINATSDMKESNTTDHMFLD